MVKNVLYTQQKTTGFEEDQCEIRRGENHDYLCWMRSQPMLQQLFCRRSQPIRFSEIAIEDIVGISIKDEHISKMVNQYYQGLVKEVESMFEAVATTVYTIESKPVQLDDGKVKSMKVPRKAEVGTYRFIYVCRPSDGQVKRYVKWTDERRTCKPYTVDSLFFKGSGFEKVSFDSECGILVNDYKRYLRMQRYHEEAIEKRSKSKPWIQHMSALQNQTPQGAQQYGASHPGVSLPGKKANVVETDKYIMLPPEYMMPSTQPLPQLDVDLKEEEDRFNTIAAKILRLASWETHDYTKSQYKNETQVAQETSQQRTVVMERHDDISSAIATIFCNCFGIYKVSPMIPIRVYAPYEMLYQMYLDGVITENVIKRNILDTHALDEEDVMPSSMAPHRDTILKHYREKDAPKQLKPPVAKKKSSSGSKKPKSSKKTQKKKKSKSEATA